MYSKSTMLNQDIGGKSVDPIIDLDKLKEEKGDVDKEDSKNERVEQGEGYMGANNIEKTIKLMRGVPEVNSTLKEGNGTLVKIYSIKTTAGYDRDRPMTIVGEFKTKKGKFYVIGLEGNYRPIDARDALEILKNNGGNGTCLEYEISNVSVPVQLVRGTNPELPKTMNEIGRYKSM